MERYALETDESLRSDVAAVLVWAEGVVPPLPSEEPPQFVVERVQAARAAGEEYVSSARRKRVRAMLRHGKYKPSGRGKPASEYLLQAALADAFPLVNPPVDVNNAISLESGLPGSIFDAGLAGSQLRLRRGLPGESYVFNPSGQSIDLEDLLVVCRRQGEVWIPCGNPVKDSMATKTRSETRDIVAVLYAPADEPAASLARWGEQFARLLRQHCGAEDAGFRIAGGTA